MPGHHVEPLKRDWKKLFKVEFFPIHESELSCRNNCEKKSPNGLYIIISAIPQLDSPLPHFIKGASCMVIKKPDDKGHDPIEFPYINRNLKLKKLDCPNGELMLGHRDASNKETVSFFIKNNLHYEEKKEQRFRCTLVTE
ncbi:uncharacterized protein LOC111696159 [Eurytemora carolleeae]|uniref:uncharacterized protein LOC111696159 n=1 Tax=Eurytemora carolleeae TaxID=1294199 RepID=UPI000C77DFEB|nr:uncharacterized protein LOC111696159 [Eurytemora carolleeae]|eukprot:XP_023321476.1 uncharacterized protein LOC111696159 [Eurytemora affinis]